MNTEYSTTESASPLHNPGSMGCTPGEYQTLFKVWAPHAETASVVGDFNAWDGSRNPMQRSDDGKWSASIDNCQPGQCYQFEMSYQGKTFRKNDPYARKIDADRKTSVIFKSSYEWKKTDFSLPSHNELVIYELHVGTFAPKSKEKYGTFADVRRRLPYLKNLGVNVLEIMPTAAFPSDLSWGYNLTNPFAVEESYGGADEFRQLIDEAHHQGIGIILDVVYNHFGPADLDLWQFDGWSENNLGGIYFYNDWRSWTPWGDNRPDYGRGEVRQYIKDNALMWYEDYHVDGLRLDSTIFMRDAKGNSYCADTEIPEAWSLFQWLNEEVEKHFPGKIMIAEDLVSNPWVTKSTGEGGAGFNAQWDAGFVHPVRAALINQQDENRDMNATAQAVAGSYNGNAFSRVIYTESHDEVANGKARVTTEISPDDSAGYHAKKRSTLGAGLVMTSPGIPMLFEGQEFLEDGWFSDDVPVDWMKASEYKGIAALYRDLIHLRINKTGTSKGLTGSGLNIHHVNDRDDIIAFHRFYQGGAGDDVLVVANFSHKRFEDYRIGAPAAGKWSVRFNSDWEGYSPDFGDLPYPLTEIDASGEIREGLPATMCFALAPYSLLILSQDAK